MEPLLALCVLLLAGSARGACLDRLAGEGVCDFLSGEEDRRQLQFQFHRMFFPRDPLRYNVHPPHHDDDAHGDATCFHAVRTPPCTLDDILSDPRNHDLQGLPVDTASDKPEGLRTMFDEIMFVLQSCGADALRLPEDIPGDGDLSELPTIALPPRAEPCPCSAPTAINFLRAEHYDDRRAAQEQCDDPSLADMIAEDGPQVRAHLRYLMHFLVDVARNS